MSLIVDYSNRTVPGILEANNFRAESSTRTISPKVVQMSMTVKALTIRSLPPIVTFQGPIKSRATSDHGMKASFLGGTSTWPRPGSL
jgi:hypothetical protein